MIGQHGDIKTQLSFFVTFGERGSYISKGEEKSWTLKQSTAGISEMYIYISAA